MKGYNKEPKQEPSRARDLVCDIMSSIAEVVGVVSLHPCESEKRINEIYLAQ